MENRMARSDPRPAEAAALDRIAPHLKAMKKDIMCNAIVAGDRGLIPDEFLGLINTVRRRFTELWKEGQLKPTNRTRLNRRGNQEMVWVVGRDEAGMKPRETKSATIAQLRAEIDRLRSIRFVFLERDVCGELPFAYISARPGLYEVDRNAHGAVSVKLKGGRLLGVKPGEFLDVGPILD